MGINDTLFVKGCVTREWFLLGKSLPEMEAILGYRPGRLDPGAWLLALNRLPANDEFKFAGYTHWPGGKPTSGARPALAFDEEKVKNQIRSEKWRLSGPDRLVKVIPVTPHSDIETYPVGRGAEQWILTREIPATVIASLQPGDVYLPYARPR